MLLMAVPACYFAGYAYREYYDPDATTNRLQTLEESRKKVSKQLAEVEAHRDKLEGRKASSTDIPGKAW
ncbi:hypothetical protein DFQ27_003942 [Actinomortierella ambigua]|uniref:Uncharacterized protein n=1 Tax=Actinomortierella ambigua TaxID=1343610 RepID=A0A9P6U567_9FUNG|nr:hypothetical protein DFQ26_009321 [Actinomortierella ambigua]KAG0259658.1 hypothetical protein DFQ27_003942 [Actinomortierella ambigua]